jgi:hypothetical protein
VTVLLNAYTQAVLAEAEEVAATLPVGYVLTISAHSDIVLDRSDGQWVALEMRGIDKPKRTWRVCRGSLFEHDDDRTWPTLAQAVAAFTS